MSSERLERVSNAVQGYIDRDEIAGAVTLIARRGKVVHFESQGFRDKENKAPMTGDTIFRIASMTKPIASVALMQLWEQGLFQLRDPLATYLPEFTEMTVAVAPDDDEYVATPYKRIPAARPITIQHILTHTAGFPNSYRGLTMADYAALGADRPATVGEMTQRLAELPLNFHPGDRWEYGPATDVVGRLVEVLSGKTLEQYLQDHIFDPLDMPDTRFYFSADKVDRFAALYRPGEDGKIVLAEAPTTESRYIKGPKTYFSGGGGLTSTARDYFRFHQMMLNGGELDGKRILGPKTIELMTSNHIGDLNVWLRGPGYGFGLGYSVVTDKGLSGMPSQVGTYSWGGAFCTVFWVDPEEELIGILMTQVRPYTHINIRQDLTTTTYQALLE
jgi:CubicO group peptidase (beta-lactamase class C family)